MASPLPLVVDIRNYWLSVTHISYFTYILEHDIIFIQTVHSYIALSCSTRHAQFRTCQDALFQILDLIGYYNYKEQNSVITVHVII